MTECILFGRYVLLLVCCICPHASCGEAFSMYTSIKLPECALKAHKLIRFPLADILDSKTLCRCAHRFVTRGYIDCSNTKSLPTLPTHQLTRFLICHRYRAVQEVVSFERAPRYIGCVDCSAHTWRESYHESSSHMQTNMPQINLQVGCVPHAFDMQSHVSPLVSQC